jgi:hypothetical protein
MFNEDSSVFQLWIDYNRVARQLTQSIGGTKNIVGEFAERLVCSYYGGELLPASSKSADIRLPNQKCQQVKSRRLPKIKTTSLNVIRSWDFDDLVVVRIFRPQGNTNPMKREHQSDEMGTVRFAADS